MCYFVKRWKPFSEPRFEYLRQRLLAVSPFFRLMKKGSLLETLLFEAELTVRKKENKAEITEKMNFGNEKGKGKKRASLKKLRITWQIGETNERIRNTPAWWF